jgi:hypothetical protein
MMATTPGVVHQDVGYLPTVQSAPANTETISRPRFRSWSIDNRRMVLVLE